MNPLLSSGENREHHTKPKFTATLKTYAPLQPTHSPLSQSCTCVFAKPRPCLLLHPSPSEPQSPGQPAAVCCSVLQPSVLRPKSAKLTPARAHLTRGSNAREKLLGSFLTNACSACAVIVCTFIALYTPGHCVFCTARRPRCYALQSPANAASTGPDLLPTLSASSLTCHQKSTFSRSLFPSPRRTPYSLSPLRCLFSCRTSCLGNNSVLPNSRSKDKPTA